MAAVPERVWSDQANGMVGHDCTGAAPYDMIQQ